MILPYESFLDTDVRVSDWPMMNSPTKTLVLVFLYLCFVKWVGPTWMRHRQRFELRSFMIIYNLILVAISAWMFLELGFHGWFTKYSWWCEHIDFSYNRDSIWVAEICWYFYLTKFVEFTDTVIFVLRKKDSQISSLHIFHHSLVPITAWYGVKHGGGGYNSIFAFLNSFVHVWMYLYYGLSAIGPKVRKYLWWKKYLTALQMVQFCVVFFMMIAMCIDPNCRISPNLLVINLGQAVIFFGLFLQFYKNSYLQKKRHNQKVITSPPLENGFALPQDNISVTARRRVHHDI